MHGLAAHLAIGTSSNSVKRSTRKRAFIGIGNRELRPSGLGKRSLGDLYFRLRQDRGVGPVSTGGLISWCDCAVAALVSN